VELKIILVDSNVPCGEARVTTLISIWLFKISDL